MQNVLALTASSAPYNFSFGKARVAFRGKMDRELRRRLKGGTESSGGSELEEAVEEVKSRARK